MGIATPRFLDALQYAVQLHGDDVRKVNRSVPYIAHLLAVCSLVLLDGGSEEEAIAALLHDALEDHPNETSRGVIAERFGEIVLGIVEACTDTPATYSGGPKPPWKDRKRTYLKGLKKAGQEVLRVSLADKLDNARAILTGYRQQRDVLWLHFNAGKEDQLWFYRSLRQVFREAGTTGFLTEEFERVVSEIEGLAEETC